MRIIEETKINSLNEMLRTSLILVADDHGVPDARLLVQAMLLNCKVRALILEVPSDCAAPSGTSGRKAKEKYGSSLQEATENMSSMKLNAGEATRELETGAYFTTPHPYERGLVEVGQDVSPNLRVLAGIAVSKNIPVVPCDTNYRKVLNKLQSDVGEDTTLPITALFAGNGLAYRDLQTAERVREFIQNTGITSGLLMLWGGNHIPSDIDRIGLEERLIKAEIHVMVLPHPASFLTDEK